MKLGVDVNRHKEIIVKAISAILLLLLKHFKLNHIYQVGFTDVTATLSAVVCLLEQKELKCSSWLKMSLLVS